ncbi:hypothetical protein BC834DRAFT_601141 [Gloeopeniophorella convolvens]|nr:hypothetical protein BC834DRAFT_601141 [Gloeopeniophorella convolvens]
MPISCILRYKALCIPKIHQQYTTFTHKQTLLVAMRSLLTPFVVLALAVLLRRLPLTQETGPKRWIYLLASVLMALLKGPTMFLDTVWPICSCILLVPLDIEAFLAFGRTVVVTFGMNIAPKLQVFLLLAP